ncbi:ATP-dependent DNA helicase RecG [hydrothermal vent metagenome]|uniref:ATP-dependent DNA helicase RecG n=1 Tax=hydrothermal vent metagenome TaxID=652676 RepID=A0A1W1C3S2_9ZZZZ
MKEIKERFTKLHIDSFCELALIIPKGYEDYRLHSSLKVGSKMLIDATINQSRKSPASLQLDLYAHNLGHSIQGVLFRPKPYMLHQFPLQKRLYLYGQIECKTGHCSILMPKIISEANIGTITPIYKTPLRLDVMRRFMAKHLTLQALTDEGLPKEIAKTLLMLHFPKELPTELTKEQLHALKFTELFVYMKKLRQKRVDFEAISSEVSDISKWIHSLPFTLTNEQQKAIEDIRQDLQKSTAARRMIVGDVGSGKTMVILASALLNAPKRSILMAPTTILAQQLYEEAKKFAPQLKTVLVTNKSKKEPLDAYDFIIGTHALLYRELPEATLVMVDEQHRFGTAQRAHLAKLVEKKEKKPHFLQFSATPIPRTQAMIESAHIDVSLITTTPFQKDITNRVIHKEHFKELIEHVQSEKEKGNQILIIYPLVEESETISYQSIEEARSWWERKFEGVYVTHGKDKEKEEVLLEFREKGSILIATTVVEVGISLPRLSTVVIVGAERLGLATLHQLRGRVSRTGLKGYCFLYTNQKSSKRLEEFCKTTSGFDIAQMDLKYRNSGDLLSGKSQSGKQFEWVDLAEDEEIIKEVKEQLF